MSFPVLLRAARKKAGLTQRELADALGITVVSISNYEKGLSFPLPYILYDLADVLHVDPKEFLRASEDE